MHTAASIVSPVELEVLLCRDCSLKSDICVRAAYMSTPCHIELTLSEKDAAVKTEQTVG